MNPSLHREWDSQVYSPMKGHVVRLRVAHEILEGYADMLRVRILMHSDNTHRAYASGCVDAYQVTTGLANTVRARSTGRAHVFGTTLAGRLVPRWGQQV